jgi:hypothetical protein
VAGAPREEQSFQANDIFSESTEGVQYRKPAPDGTQLEFIRSTFRFGLNHVLAGIWRSQSPVRTTGSVRSRSDIERRFVFGAPTVPQDLPTSGTVSFTYLGSGLYVSPADLRGVGFSRQTEAQSLRADFSAGTIRATLSFGSCTGSGEPCGDYMLSGNFGSGQASFEGTLVAVSGGYSGRFAGGFFGPRAEEVGFAFELQRADGARAVGHALGQVVR